MKNGPLAGPFLSHPVGARSAAEAARNAVTKQDDAIQRPDAQHRQRRQDRAQRPICLRYHQNLPVAGHPQKGALDGTLALFQPDFVGRRINLDGS